MALRSLAAALGFPVPEPAAAVSAGAALRANGDVSTFARVDSVMTPTATATTTTTTTKTDQEAVKARPVGSAGLGTDGGDASAGGVRILALHEWKAAAASLAAAFADDPSSRYFLDTPDRAHWSAARKYALHLRMMEYITYAHLLKGLVVCSGPNYDCVALWMPPGENMDDWLTIARSGMWRLQYQLSREGRRRFFAEFLPLLNATKARVLGGARDAASWYLVYLGTRPEGRGRGHARAAVAHVARRADRERRPCYLESSHAVNRVIYAKWGFELRANIALRRAEVPVELDIMVREPVMPEGEETVGEEPGSPQGE